MLDASLFLSCARVLAADVLRRGDEPFRRWEAMDDRGVGCRGGEIWLLFSPAMTLFACEFARTKVSVYTVRVRSQEATLFSKSANESD